MLNNLVTRHLVDDTYHTIAVLEQDKRFEYINSRQWNPVDLHLHISRSSGITKNYHSVISSIHQSYPDQDLILSVNNFTYSPWFSLLALYFWVLLSDEALKQRCQMLGALLGVTLLIVLIVDIGDAESSLVSLGPLKVVQ